MMNTYVMPLVDVRANLETVGGKGMSLAKLAGAGIPVPGGFHITTAAYRHFVASNGLQPKILAALKEVDLTVPATLENASQSIRSFFAEGTIPAEIADEIRQAYESMGQPAAAVAVRSSATAEDLPEASFAGQQETYLNISGSEQVLGATKRCWASLWTGRAIGYRSRQNIPADTVALAVVVQELVPAEGAGILFTANPLNGNRNEAVINAAWGLGEAVVGGMVTPDTITVDRQSGKVISRETAEKLVMTIRNQTGTEEQPVPEARRKLPVLNDEQAVQLAAVGAQIEDLYGVPMDIEWTIEGGAFAIVQARPVTALPEAPLEWKPPDPKGSYMRTGVVDLMPAPLSPLFISWGIPTLKEQMKPLAIRIGLGEPVLQEDYYTSINAFAYMNAAFPARAWWWILTGMLPAYPRLLRNLVRVWREELHPEYVAAAARFNELHPEELSTGELWKQAQELFDSIMYYVSGLLFATMGASAGSEALLTRIYDKFARREGDPEATVLLMGWDSIPVRAEKALYDLASWVRGNPELTEHLLQTPSELLKDLLQTAGISEDVLVKGWGEFRERFNRHMKDFGYIIYQLDFAESLPLDHPEPMLENIKMYLRGEGTNPHQRQQTSQEIRLQTAKTMRSRLKGVKGWAFRNALNWGQSLAEIREDALSDIGLGYPMLRCLLLELGKRLAEAHLIDQAEQVFWLQKEEVECSIRELEQGRTPGSLMDRVRDRIAFNELAKKSTPPPMLPMKKRIMGIKTDIFLASTEAAQTDMVLKGVAASPGRVSASARVLRGPGDFDQMRPGEVLVAGTTTPAWTPLFAMAAAVVTDIGGPLSHGSIVAREYGIPAVMGTGVATRRIIDGQTITVDGSAGTVELAMEGSKPHASDGTIK